MVTRLNDRMREAGDEVGENLTVSLSVWRGGVTEIRPFCGVMTQREELGLTQSENYQAVRGLGRSRVRFLA
jgi:hypothetical protein